MDSSSIVILGLIGFQCWLSLRQYQRGWDRLWEEEDGPQNTISDTIAMNWGRIMNTKHHHHRISFMSPVFTPNAELPFEPHILM
jgi:hypothetical protein